MNIYRVAYYKGIETTENSAVSVEIGEELPRSESFFTDYEEASRYYRLIKINPTATKQHYVTITYHFDVKCLESSSYDETDDEDTLEAKFYAGYTFETVKYEISNPYTKGDDTDAE